MSSDIPELPELSNIDIKKLQSEFAQPTNTPLLQHISASSITDTSLLGKRTKHDTMDLGSFFRAVKKPPALNKAMLDEVARQNALEVLGF
jgi:hypothetical protein